MLARTHTYTQMTAWEGHQGPSPGLGRSKRCQRVIITDEAAVLKLIREEKKQKLGREFTLRAVARKLGRTDSWLAQVENGRADIPRGELFESLLEIYGLKRKSFNERLRLFRKANGPRRELESLLEIMDRSQLARLVELSKNVLRGDQCND